MKKLLTLLMALVMVFALATPAMAWVGWDAPEAADPEDDAILKDFELSGLRLEYFASASATFSWNREYYKEYDPANKGIVEGTHIRGYFSLTLPAKSDVPATVLGQLDYMAVNIAAGNMRIDNILVYRSVEGDAERTKLHDYTVGATSHKYTDITFHNTKEVCYEFMVTGYALSTKDVTLTAKLGIGQTAFVSGVYKFTTANGVSYEVKHSGNYFYIENKTPRTATPGIVRFTVDKDNKVTDIAVSIGSGTLSAHTITNITKYAYQDYLDDNAAQKVTNTKAIQAYQLAIVKQHWNLIYKDKLAFDTWLAAQTVAGIEDAYNGIAKGLGLDVMTYRDTVDANNNPVNGDYDNDDIIEILEDAGYTVIYFTNVKTYRDITKITKLNNGDVAEVVLSDVKYCIDNGNRKITDLEQYYYASTNADTAKTVFTVYSSTQSLGYMSREEVYNWYNAISPVPASTTLAYQYYTAVVTNDWANDPDDQWAGKVDLYQFPSESVGSAAITPTDSAHADYLAIFKEVLGVLGFEWDGTTKYMFEAKFAELFGAGVSISNTLTWKAYTADLIVPDGTEPPQTGDSASIVGFVMIALAVLAAGAVVIKKVRA